MQIKSAQKTHFSIPGQQYQYQDYDRPPPPPDPNDKKSNTNIAIPDQSINHPSNKQ